MKLYPVSLGFASLLLAGEAHADDQEAERICLVYKKCVMTGLVMPNADTLSSQ